MNLDERLSSVASFVPEKAVLLDVGTDHGYLPVSLLLDGKIKRAGASDINPDPLSRAVETAEKYGVKDKISFYLSDGLEDIPDIENYTCISVCGMGGELISKIIDRSEYVKQKKIPLILQPMSSADDLSKYLAESGFNIVDEAIAFAAGKLYRIIFAVYDGIIRTLSPVEYIIGRRNIEKGKEQLYFFSLLEKYISKYQKVFRGKCAGGIDAADEKAILSELYDIAKKEGFEIEDK